MAKKPNKKTKPLKLQFTLSCTRLLAMESGSAPHSVSRLSYVTCFHQWNVTEYVIACAFPFAIVVRTYLGYPSGPRIGNMEQSHPQTHDQASQTTKGNPAGISLDQLNPADM